VKSSNARAVNAYERNNFKQEGLLRHAAHIDGKYVDLIVMGILRNEFYCLAM